MKSEMMMGLAVLLLALLGGWYLFSNRSLPMSQHTSEAEVVRETVVQFGSKLKFVSLLSSPAERRADMELYYGPYVAPELLAEWTPEGVEAIGRHSSSPWPERIDVVSVTESGTGYVVEGNVIEVTSDKVVAAVYPISLRLLKRGNVWLIVEMEKGAYSQVPQRVSLVGFWECVPLKPEVPQTEECVPGIAVDQSDGHVVVDLTLMTSAPLEYAPGTKVTVEGVLVPANQLSAGHWQDYDIDGIMSATTLSEITRERE